MCSLLPTIPETSSEEKCKTINRKKICHRLMAWCSAREEIKRLVDKFPDGYEGWLHNYNILAVDRSPVTMTQVPKLSLIPIVGGGNPMIV